MVVVRRGYDSFFWNLLSGSVDDLLAIFAYVVALIALIVVLIWAVVGVRSRYRDDDDPAATDRSMLLGLGDLHRGGDLSDEEYRSIKKRLVKRIESSMSADSQAEQ